MPSTDIGSADYAAVRSSIQDYDVDSASTDAATGQKEFKYQIENWSEYLGYYKSIPELQTAVDAKANWTVGAGYTSDMATTMLLDTIKGNGKDSFVTILGNMIRTYTIAGDSFTEIIRSANCQSLKYTRQSVDRRAAKGGGTGATQKTYDLCDCFITRFCSSCGFYYAW